MTSRDRRGQHRGTVHRTAHQAIRDGHTGFAVVAANGFCVGHQLANPEAARINSDALILHGTIWLTRQFSPFAKNDFCGPSLATTKE